MARKIVLVSCVKSKAPTAAAARDLYTSPLFRALRAYAEREADAWYILSAEHGLLHPDRVIEPYERTLNTMKKADRLAWAARVRRQLASVVPDGSRVIVLAGARYREHLLDHLRQRGCEVTIPLEGLSFGRQLQHLKRISDRVQSRR